MISYFAIISILVVFSMLEDGEEGSYNYGKAACILLILFGGLRFETGFDWMEYENYYDLTQPIWSNTPQYVSSTLLVEPGFAVFVTMVRSLGLPFQALLFAITLINMTVLYCFAKRYTSRIAFVFLIYFGFVFLAGQMAAIRQTLSYSFVILAFMKKDRDENLACIALLIVAVSIHTFSVVFAPMMFIRPRFAPTPVIIGIVTAGVVTAYSGFYILPIVADTILPLLGGGFLSTKLSLYADYEGASISLASLMFIPIHIAIYYLLTSRRYPHATPPDGLIYFAVWLTILSLITHSYLGVFPALWNRVSYISFLVQPIALTARYRAYFADRLVPVASTLMAGSAGAAITLYALSSPTSLPYLPYQNAAVVWATGNQGDGRFRYAYAFHQAESEIANKRR